MQNGRANDWYDRRLEAQARSHDQTRAILFLLRFALLFALAALFWKAGWSRALAEGLRNSLTFPFGWALRHMAFVALAVFGYEAILFPLSVLADYSFERAHDRSQDEFGDWLRGFLTTLLLEIVLVTGAFTALYALMRLFPSVWWIWAAGGYALIVMGLGEWGPSHLLPLMRPPVNADESAELLAQLRQIGREAGLEITGVAWWNFDHQDQLEHISLNGMGRRRRVVFSEWAWKQLAPREQLFLAARLMAWHRHHLSWAVQALQLALTALALLGSAFIADSVARYVGLAGVASPAAFPFWVTALFGCAALAGLFAHALVRRLELRADRFALRHAGGPDALQTLLRQEFSRQPFAVSAPYWQTLLLRRMPTPAQRLDHAARANP